MARMRHKQQPTFEVAFVVTLETGDVVMGDWGPATEEQLDSIQQALEDFRSLAHFSVVRDGVDVFINPTKILYVEVLTRDLDAQSDQ